jgi:hypothetical protein
VTGVQTCALPISLNGARICLTVRLSPKANILLTTNTRVASLERRLRTAIRSNMARIQGIILG